MGVFNKTIIPLGLVGYEMIIANSALRASLALYISCPTRPRGIIVKYGEAPPERGWILLVEVYERVGKSVIWVCERVQKGRTDECYGFIKSGKRSIFVISSYLNDNAFTAVKREAKFLKEVYERGIICQ